MKKRKFIVLTDYGPQTFEDVGTIGSCRVGRHAITGEWALFQIAGTPSMPPSQPAPSCESPSVGWSAETLQAMPLLTLTERFALALAQGWAVSKGMASEYTDHVAPRLWQVAGQFANARPTVH